MSHPTWLTVLLLLAGTGVITATLLDAFRTILGASGMGRLSRTWSQALWRGGLALHRRRRAHTLLAALGPAILVLTILVWYSLLKLGGWLILTAAPGSVVSSSTGAYADGWQRLYFVATSTSGLGYGDLVPIGPPWTIVATTLSLLGTIVLTMSLSYVLSVLGAAVRRRSTASSVLALGETPTEVVRRATSGSDAATTRGHLLTLAAALGEGAEQHRAFPVLRFFHAATPERSTPRAALLLGDATHLLGRLPADRRPGEGVLAALQHAVGTTAEVEPAPPEAADGADSRERLATMADELGCEDDEIGLRDYLETRRRLVAACRDDGWEE